MIEKRILVVEDSPAMLKLIAGVLKTEGYEVAVAENGIEALEKFKEKPFPLVLTDLEMPKMNGIELIDNLNSFQDTPLILVITSNKEPAIIIDIMKKGVYDYLVKPLDIDGIPIKIKRAFESLEMKKNISIIEKEKMIRLEQQLDWYRWMDRVRNKDDIDINNMEKSFLHRLQTIFNQGSGFGNLVAVIDILTFSVKEDGDFYKIKKEVIDILKENKEKAQRGLDVIQEIDTITNSSIETEKISLVDYYNFIKQVVKDSENNARIKSQKIILSDMKISHRDYRLYINRTHFKSAIYELLLNACKFSVDNSSILVILQIQDNFAELSILNTPVKYHNDIDGIPMEYENIIFEPLFRLVKVLHEKYETLDYGLGLSKVESIVKKINGKITVSNIEDHTDLAKNLKTRVNFTISLPVFTLKP